LRTINAPTLAPTPARRSLWQWVRSLWRGPAARTNAAPTRQIQHDEVSFGAEGRSGRRNHRSGLGGAIRISDDENRLFRSPGAWVDQARLMLRSDSKLGGAWEYVRGFQEAALEEAFFAPPEGDTSLEAQAAAAFWNENLGLADFRGRGRMWRPLRPQMTSILLWQAFGVSVHEELYTTGPWAAGGGREMIWLRSWEPRSASLIEEWHPSVDGDRWVAATMRRPDGFGRYRLPIGNDPEMPGKGSLHIAHDLEGGDPEGRLGSILRHCYGPWRIKRHALDQLHVGLDRWGSPIPVLRIFHKLAEDLGINPAELEDLRGIAEATLANLRAREESWAADSDVAEVREFGGNFQPQGIVEVINLLNHEQLTAFFMHWLVMGIAATHGSRSASLTHSNAVHQVGANYAERTAEEITAQTVARINAWNFGARWPVPRLILPGIRPNAAESVLPHMIQAIATGAVTPDDGIEEWIRRAGGAPTRFAPRGWRERLEAAKGGVVQVPGPGRPEGSINA